MQQEFWVEKQSVEAAAKNEPRASVFTYVSAYMNNMNTDFLMLHWSKSLSEKSSKSRKKSACSVVLVVFSP